MAAILAMAIAATTVRAGSALQPRMAAVPTSLPPARPDADRVPASSAVGPLYAWRGALMRPAVPGQAFAVRGSSEGMRIRRVEPGSPAADAGLKPGDIVVGLDKIPTDTPRNLALAIADHCCGPTVTLEVRRGRRSRDVKVLPPS
jgi:S1-C subfamily serine protease